MCNAHWLVESDIFNLVMKDCKDSAAAKTQGPIEKIASLQRELKMLLILIIKLSNVNAHF